MNLQIVNRTQDIRNWFQIVIWDSDANTSIILQYPPTPTVADDQILSDATTVFTAMYAQQQTDSGNGSD